MTLTDDIRRAAARVAREAASVRIAHDALEAYARELPAQSPPTPDLEGADDETRAAFSLQLNAINFGSGWFPTIRKPQGLSGFRTMEAALRARGPWTARQLQSLTRDEVARTFGQDPGHVLMGHFTRHLNELGTRIDGSFLAFVREHDDAEHLATTLSTWPTWFDVSPYPSGEVPFFKRAQIAAGDLGLWRPRAPDAVRRQPRPARPAHRRGADLRPRPRAPASTRASCSSTTPPRRSRSAPSRCTPSSCSSRRTRTPRPPPTSTGCSGHGEHNPATRRIPATAPPRPPTEQPWTASSRPAAPRTSSSWKASPRSRTRCASPRRSSRSPRATPPPSPPGSRADLGERFGAVVTREGLPDGDILIVAKRPPFAPRPGPAIRLAHAAPTDLGRAIRVAAAAGVATVYTGQDPWSEAALRASQGLHFALALGRPDGPLDDVTLVFGADTEVATREGTTLDLPTRLAAALWSR